MLRKAKSRKISPISPQIFGAKMKPEAKVPQINPSAPIAKKTGPQEGRGA